MALRAGAEDYQTISGHRRQHSLRSDLLLMLLIRCHRLIFFPAVSYRR